VTVSRQEIEREVSSQFTAEMFEKVKEDALGEADSLADDVITEFVASTNWRN